MKNIRNFFFILFCLLVLSSCGSSTKDSVDSDKEDEIIFGKDSEIQEHTCKYNSEFSCCSRACLICNAKIPAEKDHEYDYLTGYCKCGKNTIPPTEVILEGITYTRADRGNIFYVSDISVTNRAHVIIEEKIYGWYVGYISINAIRNNNYIESISIPDSLAYFPDFRESNTIKEVYFRGNETKFRELLIVTPSECINNISLYILSNNSEYKKIENKICKLIFYVSSNIYYICYLGLDDIYFPEPPSRTGKKFVGWTANGRIYDENSDIVTDLELYPEFTSSFVITYLGLNGEVIKKQTVEFGETVELYVPNYEYYYWQYDNKNFVTKIQYDYSTDITLSLIIYDPNK